MTKPSPDQFRIAGRTVEHVPTGAVLEFPRKQPWTSNGYSQCEVRVGLADTDLPSGERYSLRDIMDAAWRLLGAKPSRAA